MTKKQIRQRLARLQRSLRATKAELHTAQLQELLQQYESLSDQIQKAVVNQKFLEVAHKAALGKDFGKVDKVLDTLIKNLGVLQEINNTMAGVVGLEG